MSVADRKYVEARTAGRKLQGRWVVTKILGNSDQDIRMAVTRREDDERDIKVVRHRTAHNIKIGDCVEIFECPSDITFLAATREGEKESVE